MMRDARRIVVSLLVGAAFALAIYDAIGPMRVFDGDLGALAIGLSLPSLFVGVMVSGNVHVPSPLAATIANFVVWSATVYAAWGLCRWLKMRQRQPPRRW